MKFLFCCLISLAVFSCAQGQTLNREIPIKKGQTYLNLPVKNSSAMVRSRIKLKDKILDEFTIKLADKNPDFWVFFDVSAYQGKTLTVEVEKFTRNRPGTAQPVASTDNTPLNSEGLNMIFADAQMVGQD